ncbi:uncharacterized protein LOC131994885 [Stomoxys calcitrans]|uniref:uncharacterized protein LOC131994885 n=1 Tax=Stomoxys calcitrans TaxID=35570 RepID=UPI0027E2344E|nr:uncharacterized protein LOC131994885 [Stomoxys calcitrans]
MATSDSNSSVQMQISRVAVKAPPFWRADPLLWFKQMESQFLMAGVTQDATKFHTVVASIESNILEKTAEIIVNPPSENMYDTLKNKLISSFTDSEEKRLKKLLTNIELADKKPSELLWEMRSLSQAEKSTVCSRAIYDCIFKRFSRKFWSDSGQSCNLRHYHSQADLQDFARDKRTLNHY